MGGLRFDSRAIQSGQCRLRLGTSAKFLLRGSKLCWAGRLAMPLVYRLDVIRDNNEHFFEYLFALPNDAKTC